MTDLDAGARGLTCALAVVPTADGDREKLRASVAAAEVHHRGDFGAIIELPETHSGDERGQITDAAGRAIAHNADWLFVVTDGETVVQDVFAKAAPALRLHDVVWGAAGVHVERSGGQRSTTPSPAPQGGGENARVIRPERITRLAAQDVAAFFHAALAWWIGPAHFIRPGIALAALAGATGPAWRADYMMHLWRNARAYKTAQPLTMFNGGLPQLSDAERARFIESLEQQPAFVTVAHAGRLVRLPYTGANPVIERDQSRGQFFEHEELDFLAERLPRGLSIVDVGANTGNHTAFFAAIMQAARVTPVEADPRAVEALRAMVAENGLSNVDLSRLGTAVGAVKGRLRAIHSAGGGLGATRFVPDPVGNVPLTTLDALIEGPVELLKIDVEGMEMDVLAGAAARIARDRPFLFIEVFDATVADFTAWCDANGYRFEKLFPDKTHCNYFVVPVERTGGQRR